MLAKYMNIRLRTMIYLLIGIGYASLGCFLFEQVFFEIFIGRMQSSDRYDELILVGLSFLVFIILLPQIVVFLSTRKIYILLSLTVSFILPLSFLIGVSFTDLSTYLGIPLEMDSELEEVDAIVVISNNDLISVGGIHAASLHSRGYAGKIMVFNRKLSHYVHYLETELAIPKEAIIWAGERKKYNTRVQAQTVKKLSATYNWKRVLIVNDAYYLRRSLKVLRSKGLQNILPAPVPNHLFYSSRILGWRYKDSWNYPLSKLSPFARLKVRHTLMIRVFHEYVGLLHYALQGYV